MDRAERRFAYSDGNCQSGCEKGTCQREDEIRELRLGSEVHLVLPEEQTGNSHEELVRAHQALFKACQHYREVAETIESLDDL